MKIVSIVLKDNGMTNIQTDNGQDCDIFLDAGNIIPRGALKKEFNTIDELKIFCIENQVIE